MTTDVVFAPRTGQEYLAWEALQKTKSEWVSRRAVPHHGVPNRVSKLLTNLHCALHALFPANGPYEPFGSETKVAIPNGNYCYPDMVIDCNDAPDLDNVFPETPTVIFEILSPSNRWYDRANKIADYQLLPTCRHIVVVWSTAARVEILSRLDDDSWARAADVYEGREGMALLPAIEMKLPLEAVYRGFADADLPD